MFGLIYKLHYFLSRLRRRPEDRLSIVDCVYFVFDLVSYIVVLQIITRIARKVAESCFKQKLQWYASCMVRYIHIYV